jgi:hypothetical protein
MHPVAQRIKDTLGDAAIVLEADGLVTVSLTRHWQFQTIDPQTKQPLPLSLVDKAADQALSDIAKIQEVFR